jgi:hypothetical protein
MSDATPPATIRRGHSADDGNDDDERAVARAGKGVAQEVLPRNPRAAPRRAGARDAGRRR